MSALVIDGSFFAESVRERVAAHASQLKEKNCMTPGLAVVLVGEDPASQVYVRNKGVRMLVADIASFEHKLPDTTSEADLLALIDRLNADGARHPRAVCRCPGISIRNR